MNQPRPLETTNGAVLRPQTLRTVEPESVARPERALALKPLVLLAGILLVALFLRVYRLEVVGWMPDNYERMTDAVRLAHGHLPQSRIYPPGITVLLAPFFVFLPATLVTAQCLIIATALGLIALGYENLRRFARAGIAPLLFAFLLATSGPFVGGARDSHYDILVTALVALAVFLAPGLQRRSLPAYAGYGLLLAVLMNIRSTNLFLVPIVFFYWLDPLRPGWTPRAGLRQALSPAVFVTLATVAGITAVSILTGRWFSNSASSPFTLEAFATNVTYYAGVVTSGPAAVFTLPLALAGGIRLWRTERTLAVTILLLLLVWPFVHSPFVFNSTRYMLPASYFYLALVALGPEALWSWRPRRSPVIAKLVRLYVALAVAAIAVFFLALSLFIVHKWPVIAAQADSVLYRQVNPVIETLPPDSVVISAVGPGFPSDAHADYVDLIDEALDRGGVTPTAIENVEAQAAAALADGRPVFYLYSRWEAGVDFQGNGREGYHRYFDAMSARFTMREVFRTTSHVPEEKPWLQYPWVLYEVTPK